MIEVSITINGWNTLKRVRAVRVAPIGNKLRDKEICTYVVSCEKSELGTINHPYGDAIGLSIKMLEAARYC